MPRKGRMDEVTTVCILKQLVDFDACSGFVHPEYLSEIVIEQRGARLCLRALVGLLKESTFCTRCNDSNNGG
jgi:hypothetical protein